MELNPLWDNYFPIPNSRNAERLIYFLTKDLIYEERKKFPFVDEDALEALRLLQDILVKFPSDESMSYLTYAVTQFSTINELTPMGYSLPKVSLANMRVGSIFKVNKNPIHKLIVVIITYPYTENVELHYVAVNSEGTHLVNKINNTKTFSNSSELMDYYLEHFSKPELDENNPIIRELFPNS